MKEGFIYYQEFIRQVNLSLKNLGLPQIVNEEMLKQILMQNGWIDYDGNITEEGINSGMIKKGPSIDLN